MAHTTVPLATGDGTCNTALFESGGSGAKPAVVFFTDGGGPRPSQFSMAERLASHGYLVVMPDLFHRVGPYDPRILWAMVMDPKRKQEWRDKFYASATNQHNFQTDVTAVLQYLTRRGDVLDRVGTTGYCMGGNLSLRAAGRFPDRVAAAASFHGGGLAGDSPDSPHLLAPQMKARVYVASAVEDGSFPEAMKQRLEDALTAAKVEHVIETYAGARHGFCVSDSPAYDPAASERHWTALLGLLRRTLKGQA